MALAVVVKPLSTGAGPVANKYFSPCDCDGAPRTESHGLAPWKLRLAATKEAANNSKCHRLARWIVTFVALNRVVVSIGSALPSIAVREIPSTTSTKYFVMRCIFR